MSRIREKELRGTCERLDQIMHQLKTMVAAEQETFDALPESKKYSNEGVRTANNLDCLLYALDLVNDAIGAMRDVEDQLTQ